MVIEALDLELASDSLPLLQTHVEGLQTTSPWESSVLDWGISIPQYISVRGLSQSAHTNGWTMASRPRGTLHSSLRTPTSA